MKAIRLVQPGTPLTLHSVAVPVPGPREVLIRVKAAGICHSDAHYRAGRSEVSPLPLTLGHEVAGEIAACGPDTTGWKSGERVCVHYLATCGACHYCQSKTEQFCASARMIGKYRDGGFAEFIAMPDRSVFRLPSEIPYPQGAILMCSSATSLHALRKARLAAGETVAIFGIGGLGLSAVQLAQTLGASRVLAVDKHPRKLELAAQFGAEQINATAGDPVKVILEKTSGRGVDVAFELIGLPLTMQQAVRSLAVLGRAALAGLTQESFAVAPYSELINKEAEIIGVSDHRAKELPELLEFARTGQLRLDEVITRTVPLDAESINDTLNRLEENRESGRVVVIP